MRRKEQQGPRRMCESCKVASYCSYLHVLRSERDWSAGDRCVEHVWVKIGTVGPDDRAEFGIHADLGELRDISERRKDATELKHGSEIDLSGNAVFKAKM